MDSFNPLNDSHYQAAATGCAECQRLRDYLVRLQRLGLQVDGHIAQVDATQAFLDGVRREFFPGRS